MVNNYSTIKVKQDTISLIPKAKEVFNTNNKVINGINLTNDFIIKRVLEYYIKS